MPTWTQATDPDAAAAALPAWFAPRMMGTPPGSFGLLLSTGDVLRVAAIRAVHLGSDGTILLDVRLDHAGVPALADTAWQSRHYLGVPVPGASTATVNLAHVVCAVAFTPTPEALAELEATEAAVSATVVEIRHAAETAVERQDVA